MTPRIMTISDRLLTSHGNVKRLELIWRGEFMEHSFNYECMLRIKKLYLQYVKFTYPDSKYL